MLLKLLAHAHEKNTQPQEKAEPLLCLLPDWGARMQRVPDMVGEWSS